MFCMRSFCDGGCWLIAAAGIKPSNPAILNEGYDAQALARWEKTPNYHETSAKCIVALTQAQISNMLWEDTALAESKLNVKSTYDLVDAELLESHQNFARIQHSVAGHVSDGHNAFEPSGIADEATEKILGETEILYNLYTSLPILLKRNNVPALVHCAALCRLFAEKAYVAEHQTTASECDEQYTHLSDPTRLVAKQLNEVSKQRGNARLLYKLCLRADDDVDNEKWDLSQETDLSTHATNFLTAHELKESHDETFLANIAHAVLPTMEVPPPTFMSRAKFYSGQVTKILESLPHPPFV